ncbi:MAG0110 family membrane protein [Mycoplasmopsis alligatoris]
MFFIGLLTFFYWATNSWFTETISKNPTAFLVVIIIGLISFFVVSIFGSRMNLFFLLLGFFFSVPFLAFLIGTSLAFYLPNLNLQWTFLLFAAPVVIMGIFGIIGYYELIDITKISRLSMVLGVVFLICVIVSFFIYGPSLHMLITVVGLILICLGTSIDFYVMRREFETAIYHDKKQMVKISVYFGIRLFFNYVMMLYYLIRFLGIFSRN